MSSPATITITSGPERGTVFPLDDELVHLGRGATNQIVLDDPELPDHQASIVKRNGRYAIYATGDGAVEVDGNVIPPEKWVWLPVSARIRVSGRTALQFNCEAAASGESRQQAAAVHTGKSRRDRNTKPRRRSEKSRRRQIARFVTDGDGEPLVQLGEDGHLPELHFTEGTARAAEKQTGGGKSLGLYLAIAFSVLLSLAMLFVNTDTTRSTAKQRAEARIAITAFYGAPGQPLKPYQKLLRSAQRAHSRGDRAAEHAAYRRVLELLNAEDVNPITGLTGDRHEKDERLRKRIAVLLGD